ncbi:MAG: hypothetical protein P4M15_07320 [Alphaproteobacteria bacterium]|nr:hypothetical protein [Alphaproteobacteria bacterium]
MTDFRTLQSALIARTIGEPFPDWIARFCRERGIPWKPEYAIPMEDREQPKRMEARR